jgi:hypothetical protein
MLIHLLLEQGIKPICTVRKEEQVKVLKNLVSDSNTIEILNSSTPDFKDKMIEICGKLKPTVCLECIAGETTG